uniref:NADH dehydrogenase subunit 2 n=1 Tax=Scalpellum stearnsi TaxID=748153 RepID=UPI00286C45BE|nr:NADH dehydrogenase subunit 2 [Scalpellum stearnsi]WKB17952.1 NADH dehydrogenase subunit 2 [Scalpellum stearnsi]
MPPLFYSFFLIFSTAITLSSKSIFSMWLGMEMNMMAFIPFMTNLENNKKSSEATIKYFIIQSLASSFFLLFSFIFYESQMLSVMNLQGTQLITLTISLKMGMAPLHLWFPEVMEGLSWFNCFILMTWQKVGPMFVMSTIFNYQMIIFLSILSSVMGAISGLNQTSLRKILAYSAISHTGWMTSLMFVNSPFWIEYLMIYSMLSFVICYTFWYFKTNYFTQFMQMKTLKMKYIIFINLFSLAGLPPLLGFYMKFFTIKVLYNEKFILFFLIFSSLITLYFYTRMCFSTFTMANPYNKVNFKQNYNDKNMTFLMMMSLTSFLGFFPMLF